MFEWLDALTNQDTASILVTVAAAEGSVPREPGAKMLVTQEREFDTIGGGHLELCAIEFARAMLEQPVDTLPAQRRLQRFPLGPTLGQCCGGVVWLAFERIEPDARELFVKLRQRRMAGKQSWRLIALDSTIPASLHGDTAPCSAELESPGFEFDRSRTCHLLHAPDGGRWLVDPCVPFQSRLFLFGAGHVGAAIVRALAELPCAITWVDQREEQFPASLPPNVSIELTDTPEVVIDAAPAGACFLVMTHSHALDQQLAEHILLRSDIDWFGLIGSRTKRIQFERRLRARGIGDDALARMTCPIGISGITGKAPAVIAIAVAAQLMQVWEKQQAEVIESLPNFIMERSR